MSKLTIFQEMVRELTARKTVLVREREELMKAETRISVIDADVAIIDAELAEYNNTPELKAENARLAQKDK